MRNPAGRPPYEIALVWTRDETEIPGRSAVQVGEHDCGRFGPLYGWVVWRAREREREAA